MKTYNAPSLVEYGTASALTADSRDSSAADIFFDRNGDAQQGLNGSLDTCATRDDENCLPD